GVRRFAHGLLTLLGEEGRKLSGGEAQLLALTRALYGKPRLLVIDEGFSAIDADLENALAGIIAEWARHQAVLLITHNLESLRRTGYVYLMREGQIAEEGAPGELLERGGLFRELLWRKNRMLAAAAEGWS
ncbi:MAG TPA: ATP-binding cassette domain-containing protein, partial [bacterium]|nr:ATP-binding cassette domain-containing protein [bacterium]